ncbi:MAG: radical SAM protein [Theionarchaea archaeon]|nr:radical SAM protein [Theionarchaea archaeon]
MVYIRVREQVFIRKTSKGDYLLLDSAIFRVDETAQAILQLCDGTHTYEDMIHILSEQYNESPGDVEKAVTPFREYLEHEGVLALCETPSFIKPVYDYSCPSSLNIEVTYQCNEHCKFCASNAGFPDHNELGKEEIDRLLDEAISMRVTPVTITGGEPLLKKDLTFHMIRKVNAAGLNPNLLTNGTLIDQKVAHKLKEAGIHSVQVSLDGANPETHDAIRGMKGGFKKAIQGIKALKEVDVDVSISSVLTRENFHELNALYRLGQELGVPLTSANVSPTGRGLNSALLLSPQQMCEHFCYTHETDEGKISMLVVPRERCSIGTSPVITPAGDVYPCMLTKYESLRLGNIRESTLQEIWKHSEVLQELYSLDVHKVEPCKTCKHRYFCGGGCRGHAFAYHETLYKKDPYRCPATALIIEELLKRGDEETRREVLEVIE